MAAEEPEIDGRRRDELREYAAEIAPYYADEWDPESGDPGRALLRLFAEMTEGVVERLDRVPAKHRVAFFDALGFDSRPPQPSRVPLAFDIADGAGGNVTVPAGTQAVAAATDDRPEQTFEVAPGDGFDAVPANLERVYSVAPETDEIFEHWTALQGGESTRLFRVRDRTEDRQEHVLYVGHADQLSVSAAPESGSDADGAEATVRVALATDAPMEAVGDDYVWEYFGAETEDGPEDWQAFAGWSVGPTLAAVPAAFVEDLAPTLQDLGLAVSAESPTTAGFVVVEADESQRRALGEALASLLGVSTDLADALVPAIRTLDLALPGTLVETAVGAVESKWVRCRIPGDYRETALFDLRFGMQSPVEAFDHRPVWVGPKPPAAGMAPDLLLANDVELSPGGDDGELLPLGDLPRAQDAFYVASEETFTKAGVTAAVVFEPPPPEYVMAEGKVEYQAEAATYEETDGGTVDAEVAWEYWDGSAWSRLDVLSDGTLNLTEPAAGGSPASVEFPVPDDLEPTSVAGHDGHWVRARLVGGSYGEVTAWQKSEKSWVTDRNVTPPRYGGVSVEYGEAGSLKPARTLLTRNNLALEDPTDRERFAPFVRVPDDEQTLYVGVDGPLDDGPVNLLFSVAEAEYPEWFHSRVRWEYRDPADGEWVRLDVRDGTEGLTERGIVSLVFPEETVEFERFGRRCHWIRARVTGTAFEGQPSATPADPGGSDSNGGPEPCGETVRTAPPSGRPSNHWPELQGLHLNAVWVHNVRTVGDETLGSSDGTRNQAFAASSPPVTSAELWVDELQALSEGQRRDLEATRPDGVETETGPEGEESAFWVRWERVPDFLDSGDDERHYVLDRSAGRVVFGDGNEGMIPPRGADNVRLRYETGGGADGNVEAGAVSDLKSPIPFVESVYSTAPADGGADGESIAAVLERAPKRIRDRDRAVTAADFERVALDASRRLARANCISAMDRAGEHAPGWVTVLVVPSAPGEKPVPSVTLKQTVREALADHAPATLVADPEQLVVRGPSYVSVSVEADLETTGAGSVSTVEEAATEAVASFLHPLSGGEDGSGWGFGEMPCMSDLYALLEGVEGVDHVADLAMRFRGSGGVVAVREGEPTPDASPDALVHSGDHRITARIGRPEPPAANGGP